MIRNQTAVEMSIENGIVIRSVFLIDSQFHSQNIEGILWLRNN